MRFYEVQAKSVLNRVPEKSRMPFRWTVNPYRGCTPCLLLLHAGRHARPDGRRSHRHAWPISRSETRSTAPCATGAIGGSCATQVLAKWSSVKPAYAVTLEDGTELVASGDHRFLSDRGWKHVTGAEHGPRQRPHLTAGQQADRAGRLRCPAGRRRRLPARLPVRDDPRRRAPRLIRVRRGPAESSGEVHRFRLALADDEALVRSSDYLALLRSADDAVPVRGSRRASALRAMRSALSAASTSQRIAELIAWPIDPSLTWVKGFLAGIFDAEGSCGRHAIRDRQHRSGDHRLDARLSRVASASTTCIEDGNTANGLTVVRIRGGPDRARCASSSARIRRSPASARSTATP